MRQQTKPHGSAPRDPAGRRSAPAGRSSARPTRDRGGAGRPAPRSPGSGDAPRWPRNLSSRGRWVLAAVALVVVAVVIGAILWATRGEPVTESDDMPNSVAERVAELEAAEVARAEENLGLVIEHATVTQERVTPVMHELHAVLPTDDTSPAEVREAQITGWTALLDDLVAQTQAVPTGSSEHNIVRNGMAVSLGLLGDSVDALDLARTAEGEDQERLLELAASLRGRAVETWAVAATQLDLMAIAGDRGHVHVFLPVHPTDPGDGGLDLPEGDGHADH
ncbi:hypothetical protein [Oerskovia flava]|uniref:hypothetical protein n=1 Tax=Oerskovia flava TaxID=2986422 RepID=UPI00223F79B6|nr:hypothetical protein [Oerskovia sp. JB1-3-2]